MSLLIELSCFFSKRTTSIVCLGLMIQMMVLFFFNNSSISAAHRSTSLVRPATSIFFAEWSVCTEIRPGASNACTVWDQEVDRRKYAWLSSKEMFCVETSCFRRLSAKISVPLSFAIKWAVPSLIKTRAAMSRLRKSSVNQFSPLFVERSLLTCGWTSTLCMCGGGEGHLVEEYICSGNITNRAF